MVVQILPRKVKAGYVGNLYDVVSPKYKDVYTFKTHKEAKAFCDAAGLVVLDERPERVSNRSSCVIRGLFKSSGIRQAFGEQSFKYA